VATAIPTNDAAFSAWELAAATGGELIRVVPAPHGAVRGVVTDSREVKPGNCFVAVKGERFDGHDFLVPAIATGAAAVIVQRGRVVPDGDVAVIEVDDVLGALGSLARAHLRRWRSARPRARVAAVTGSAGKTTTKDLLAAILAALGQCHATRGNLNNRVGVPLVALGVADEPFVVFEVGMSVPGEIAALAAVVEPDVAVLLNVGVAHAAGFGGSRSAIAREKGALLAALPPGGLAVVNRDDDAAWAQRVRTRATCVSFGESPGADVRVVRRELVSADRSTVTLARGGRELAVALRLVGEAAALDLAAAVAAADATVGRTVPDEIVARAVAAWTGPAGRAAVIELHAGITVVDDSYNANPASMRAAFATVTELRAPLHRRGVAVLGEMRELGPISEAEHDALGQELARHGFDVVVGCGGDVDVALRRAESAGVAVRYAASSEAAGAVIAECVRPGDVVLFKGSRGAAVERALVALVAKYPRAAADPGGAR
jgi:UDP-N-acetylmuramoyl-tripeptide--D-alanyl-D-alanine ligase